MATTVKKWTRVGGYSTTNAPIAFEYDVDDETGFASINDKLAFSATCDLLPADTQVDHVNLIMDQFDSDGTPTVTFSVILTNGTTTYELIKDNIVGRTADGDSAISPGGATTDEVLGFRQVLDGTYWIELEMTAALATATSATRAIKLQVFVKAVQ